MTRTALTAAAGVALVIVLVVACLAPNSAKSRTVTAWTPLATSAFLPIDPLVRPIHSTGPGNGGRQSPDNGLGGLPSDGPLVQRPTTPPTSRPTGGIGSAVGTVKGSASYYAYVPGGAAAAARLRDAIGPNWRGRRVTVWYGGRHVSVVLSDFERSTIPGRLIDLNEGSFATLVGPGWHQRGRVWVEVTW